MKQQNQEHQAVKPYKIFAQKFIPAERLKSLAEFSWRVQNDMVPIGYSTRYSAMPRSIVEVLWWNDVTGEEEQTLPGGWILIFFEELLHSHKPDKILEDAGLLPKLGFHDSSMIYELLYATILKALAIGSMDVVLPQERSSDQLDKANILSLM